MNRLHLIIPLILLALLSCKREPPDEEIIETGPLAGTWTKHLDYYFFDTKIKEIYEDEQERIWVAIFDDTYGQVLWSENNFQYAGPQLSGLCNSTVNSICKGPWGRTWYGTKQGLCYVDSSGWTTVESQLVNMNQEIYDIMMDRDSTMWFGIDGGVVSYDGGNWKLYGDGEFMYLNVRHIEQAPDGKIWFQSEGTTLAVYDGQTWTFTKHSAATEGSFCSMSIGDDGRVWLSTEMSKVYSYDGTTLTENTPDHGDEHWGKSAVFVDSYGIVWYGNNYGISAWDGSKWKNMNPDLDFLNKVECFIEDSQGDVWFGSWYYLLEFVR